MLLNLKVIFIDYFANNLDNLEHSNQIVLPPPFPPPPLRTLYTVKNEKFS